MKAISIDVVSPTDDHLLLIGVPFVQGTFLESDGIALELGDGMPDKRAPAVADHDGTSDDGAKPDGKALPLWYTVRNRWRDGSIRWIFLHSRVPKGSHRLLLSILKGERNELPNLDLTDFVLVSGGCRFSIEEDGFTFTTPTGGVSYKTDEIYSDLASAPFNPRKASISLVERSPIAPLIRIREDERGFSRDFLVRLDPLKERMILHRRMTVFDEGHYHLKRASAKLSFTDSVSSGRTAVLDPGNYSENGTVKKGFPSGLFCGSSAGLYIDKFWQRFPAAVDCEGSVVGIEFFPDEAEPLPITGGMSYRHLVTIACGERGVEGLGRSVEAVIDQQQLTDSFACEKVYIPEGHFPAYENLNKKILYQTKNDLYGDASFPAAMAEEEMQHPDFFGLEHYGDFPAPLPEYRKEGKPTFYWDNEYDTAFGYYRGYAMYGDVEAMKMGYWHAAHMSDMDISSISGDMKYHGTGHHHCTFESEMGHVWNDGCWLNYFFSGDVWAKEEAEKLCHRIIDELCQSREKLIHGYCFAERYTGWPLMVLVAGYEALHDDAILEGARFLVDFTIDFINDPHSFYERENYYLDEPSEFYRSALMDGCKPFMMGVIMESLERYFFNTRDGRVIEPIKKICDFIIDNMWDFNRGSFMYEWNAYGKEQFEEFNQFLICLFIRGFAFAYTETRIRRYREIATIAFHACIAVLETGEGAGGKNFAQLSRSLGGFVAYLDEWRREDDRSYIESCKPATGEEFFWDGSIPELMESGKVILQKGTPDYEGEALISSVTSFIDGRFVSPVNGDRGEVSLYVYPEEHNIPHARVPTINFKTCFHATSDLSNRSGISVVTSYGRQLMVKIYDEHAREINLAMATIENRDALPEHAPTADWHFDEWHHIKIRWQAPGSLIVILDDDEMDRVTLDRPVGGALTRLCLGYRPGNWRFYGRVKLEYMRLG